MAGQARFVKSCLGMVGQACRGLLGPRSGRVRQASQGAWGGLVRQAC